MTCYLQLSLLLRTQIQTTTTEYRHSQDTPPSDTLPSPPPTPTRHSPPLPPPPDRYSCRHHSQQNRVFRRFVILCIKSHYIRALINPMVQDLAVHHSYCSEKLSNS